MLAAGQQVVRRALAACAALTLATFGVLLTPASATALDTVPLVVAASDPLVAQEDTVDVLIDTATTATADRQVDIAVSVAPISTRYNLSLWLEGQGRSALNSVATATIPAGATQSQVTVPAADLGLDRAGAYVLVATLEDGTEAASFLITDELDIASPTSLALTATVSAPTSETGLLDAATLTQSTSASGTLATQAALAQEYGLTLGVDPIVATSVAALGNDAPASAENWLSTVTELPGAFVSGYGGTDRLALLRAGVLEPRVLGLPQGDGGVTDADAIAPGPIGAPVIDATHAAVDGGLLASIGAAGIPLLSTASLDENVTAQTPSAHVAVDGVDALAADDELQTLLDAAVRAEGTSAADARARVLALLATVSLEAPSVHRTLVASMPLTGAADPLLAALQQATWLQRVSVDDVLATETREATLAPAEPSAQESTAVQLVRELLQSESNISSVLTAVDADDQPTLTVPIRLAVLAALGPASRGDDSGLAAARDATDAVAHGVTISETGTALIVSDSAELPVTVTNSLPVDVHVRVVAEETSQIVVANSAPIDVTVPAQTQQRVSVPVTAIGTGRTELRVQVLSQTSSPMTEPATMDLQVQPSVELIVVVIVGTSAALLVGFGILRSIRKRRRAALAEAHVGNEVGTA